MNLLLHPEDEVLLKGLQLAFSLLKERYDVLSRVSYEPRYARLYMNEREYENYVLDPSDPSSETMDLRITLVDLQEPDRLQLQLVSQSVFRGTFRRQLLSREYVFAIRSVAKWQTLANDVEALYKRMFEFYSLCSEIKNGFKTVGEREAAINSQMPEVSDLLAKVHSYYEKNGNYILGEATLYRSAVKSKIESLDGLLASVSKQLDIFEKLKDVGA